MKKTKNIMAEYEAFLFRKELSAGTRQIYINQALLLLQFLDGREATKDNLILYKELLDSSHLAVPTQNLYITAINSFLKYSGCDDCMLRARRVQRKNSLHNVLNLEEYGKLLDYAVKSRRMKYYYIMKTLGITGIRISELRYFTVEGLNEEVLYVHNKGKTREIYLPDKLIKALREYCQSAGINNGTIFRGNKEVPISRIAVYKMFIKIADMTGVSKKKAHPHSFRHLFALTYLEQYGNLSELSDILGHSSLEITRIYTMSTAQEKRRRMNELDL